MKVHASVWLVPVMLTWSSGWGSIFQVPSIDYSFLLSPYCTPGKEVTVHSLHIRNRELCAISLRAEYLHKLFGVLLLGRLSTFALWLSQSFWLCGSQQTVENSSRDENTRPPYLPPEKSVCRSKKQQLELDLEQQTSSKLGKECIKAVHHWAYLTYMQSTSCEMLDWMKHKLESRLPGEISITSDMQMTPPLWQKAKRN